MDATEIPHVSLSKRVSFLLDKEAEGSEELGVEGAELLGKLEQVESSATAADVSQ